MMKKLVAVVLAVGFVAAASPAHAWSNSNFRAKVRSKHVTHYGSAGDSVSGTISIRNKTGGKKDVACKVQALNRRGKAIGSEDVWEFGIRAHHTRRATYNIFPSGSQRIRGVRVAKCWRLYY